MSGSCEGGMQMEMMVLSVPVLLWLGFFLLFYHFGRVRILQRFYRITRQSMEEAARIRLLDRRRRLTQLEEVESIWTALEKQLCYSGLKSRYPFLGAEGFLLFSVLGGAVAFSLTVFFCGAVWGLAGAGIFWGAEWLFIVSKRAAAMRAVNNDLIKLLDFLGNYSITSGDVIGIFAQIGKYMGEPLRGALEKCVVEAGTTGDVGMALLSMADEIEHPQFKDLVRNIEISCRYSADFSALVAFSRRSLRDYQKSSSERKSLLREAVINLALLLGMSFFALVTVNGLLEVSVWTILVQTLPGRIALVVVGVILWLFIQQMCRLEG